MARSAWRSASGRSCSVAGMPMSVTTGTASSGPTVTLSTGTVMSAAPKPTKPRMKPAAVTPSASSTSVGTGTDGISGPACPSPARPPAPGKRERRPSARSPPGAGMRAALPASSRQLPAGGGGACQPGAEAITGASTPARVCVIPRPCAPPLHLPPASTRRSGGSTPGGRRNSVLYRLHPCHRSPAGQRYCDVNSRCRIPG